jgi:BMFP domain-containing protein YqiC
MGDIKTALEIALEKTENVKSDKAGIEQFEAKQLGKKLANAFLAGEADIAAEIKKTPAEKKESLKQGIFDVLVSQIALPSPDGEGKVEKVGKGLASVIDNKQFAQLFQQLMQIISRYLQEFAQYEQAIRQQYAPKLRHKEEELSRRLGREVHIDPLQDPEYIAFYSQHINALKGNYEPVIEQAKEEVRRMFTEK